MVMEGVSPLLSAPPIAPAFGAVVDAPNLRTQGPTIVNDNDNKEIVVPINKSNRLHNADDVAPMRMRAVVSCAAKSSLLAYFQRVNWPLNNILLRGVVFVCGEIGNIVKEFGLLKAQVSRQLLNYKRERFRFQQVAIIMHSSDLEGRICEGMLLSSDAFIAQTLSPIRSPGNPSYGLGFNNLSATLSVQPPVVRTFVTLLSENPGNTILNLLVDVMESWLKLMLETFRKTAAGIQNAQIDFYRGRELKLQSFVAEFMEEYNASGLHPPVMSKIGSGHLGRFLHYVTFFGMVTFFMQPRENF